MWIVWLDKEEGGSRFIRSTSLWEQSEDNIGMVLQYACKFFDISPTENSGVSVPHPVSPPQGIWAKRSDLFITSRWLSWQPLLKSQLTASINYQTQE